MSTYRIDDVDRLQRINEALVNRVERAMDQSRNAFSLFQTAISLEGQVRRRTDELTATLRTLERSNAELGRQKEISEKANALKTRFLAAASHDVLQPLHAAQLTVSALADLQTTDKGRELVAQVERSLDMMNDLLRTLLDISRLDAGAVVPDLGTVTLSPLVSSLIADFRPLAAARGLRLLTRIRPLAVLSDRTMLIRILQNLIANAVRYTETGGVLVAVRERGGRVVIDVIDSGVGIPEAELANVFEEFHRGNRAGIGDDGGLGLGLSIVRRLVAALGHRLDLSSRPGRGTHFRLTLGPALAGTAPTERQPAQPAGAILSGRRVLLVENDPFVVDAMRALLRGWGCSVRCANGMERARAVTDDTAWTPDLIVADQNLDQGELGSEVVTALRARLGRTVPAIMATAEPTAETAAVAAALQAELVFKPFKPAQLRALMTHMLAPGVEADTRPSNFPGLL